MSSRRKSIRVSSKEKGSISAGSAGKKTTFDEEEDDRDMAPLEYSTFDRSNDDRSSGFQGNRRNKGAAVANGDSDDDEAPEEINANSIDIQQLKALHEQIAVGKNKKKRKSRPQRSGDADEELDESVLAALGDNDVAGEGEAEGSTDTEDAAVPTNKIPTKIDKNKKSKRVAGIQVSVLGDKEELEDSFVLPPSAAKFASILSTSRNRVNYSSFASAKKLAPSRKFSRRR